MPEPEDTKILIVDDEPLARKTYTAELEKAGFQVKEADSPEAAVQLIDKGPFDIVYVDLVLPKMNGVELCKLIKQKYPDTEVVLISANPAEILKFQRDFWAAGGRDEILRKPLAENELLNVTLGILREKG